MSKTLLSENKQIYEDKANLHLHNWQTINKNELVLEAIKNIDTPKYDSYLAAIILRYWSKIESYYNKCRLVVSPEDVHSWVVGGILYAIKYQPWNNKDSSIYNDPNGPDKVINRFIESRRVTFYQQLNRYNRKINSAILSLNSLTEDLFDSVAPTYEDKYDIEAEELILKYFNKMDYFTAFMLDAIIFDNYIMPDHTKKLATHLINYNENSCRIFSNRYNIPLDKVVEASKYITNLSRFKVNSKIKSTLDRLKYNYTNMGVF